MKDFVKMVLAVLCGLLIMGFLGIFLFVGAIGSMASFGKTSPVLPKSGVLTFQFSKLNLAEQAQEQQPSLAMAQGDMRKTIGLWDAVQAVNAAAADPAVPFIFLKTDGLSAGISQLEELRTSLEHFRMSGKPVVTYMEAPTTGAYYLASVSDKIYMSSNAGAGGMINGIGTRMVFLKDLLDKAGVNVQLIRHGKYKSAGEMYVRSTPSPENIEQTRAMVESLWGNLSAQIAATRGFSQDRLDSLIDNLLLREPSDMLENGLVDELLTREQLKDKLAVLSGKEMFKDVKFIDISTYIDAKVTPVPKARQKIAVIFAEGNIVDGDQKQQVAGDRFASVISRVRADSTVKAVVLRVASPGGSVLASDKIKTEIDLLRQDKPVIASYGDYAASGGYWISNSCDKIFSDRTTLTGSIGVFGMIPDLSKTTRDILHVNVTSVGSNRHSDMYGLTRPLDAAELEYMQASIENIYDRFVGLVAEGRELSPTFVDSVAQGRVWTGSDALELGLVDEIGTLEDAIRYAAICAGSADGDLASWKVEGYPKPQSMMEAIMEMFGVGNQPSAGLLEGTPFEEVATAFGKWDFRSGDHYFARMPYQYIIR